MIRFFLGLILGVAAALPIAFLAAAHFGYLATDAKSEPPEWETAIALDAFDASVARHATRAENPIKPTDEQLLAGMKLFMDNCAGCHGDGHKVSSWGKKNFYPRVPQFGIEPPQRPDWQLFWIVKNGVRYSGMGAWDGLLPDEKLWQVATFLSKLESLPPAVAAQWAHQP